MRLLVVFCGLMLGAVAGSRAEEMPTSFDWLEVVAFAGHQTDYSGVFVYQYDNRVETSSIIHVTQANGEYEKLESLDGPKREIISHNGKFWGYHNHKMVQIGSRYGHSSFPSLLPEQLSALEANYRARQLGIERVAGYNTQVILLQPLDNLRYPHKIWVHSDSGLLLKAAVLGDDNRVLEQYAFTQLQLGGKIDRSWVKECEAAGADAKVPSDDEAVQSIKPIKSGWVADMLPSGFKKTLEIQRKMHDKHAPVTQMVFSDGLSSISIFIEPNDKDDDDEDGLSSRGAVNLYHKVLDQHLITVVGEVPPRTVMQVLDSVRYNGK